MRSWKTLADKEFGPNPENNERTEYLWGEKESAYWQRWLLKDFIKRMKLCHWRAGCDLQGIRKRAWEIVHDEGRAHLRKMRSFFHEVRESLIGNVRPRDCNNSQAAHGKPFCSIRRWRWRVCGVGGRGFVVCLLRPRGCCICSRPPRQTAKERNEEQHQWLPSVRPAQWLQRTAA